MVTILKQENIREFQLIIKNSDGTFFNQSLRNKISSFSYEEKENSLLM